MQVEIPLKKQLLYACGMMGWSIMSNLIIVMLPYFYLPPSNAGLPSLLPQLILFGVLNILSIITASGRLIDAIYDPFIAGLSDRSTNPKGRRTPFMKYASIPSVLFCSLTFFPMVKGESTLNGWWLSFTLIGFFMAATSYIIPYNALLPELAHTSETKVKLSSFQQVGFVLGIILSALVNNFADGVQAVFDVSDRMTALQYTIWGLSIFA